MLDYYKKEIYLAQVDQDDKILGRVERWPAHEKAILHRGFTVILTYQKQYLLQHRKHPAFDGYFDLTFSSHQIYVGDKLQNDLEAIYTTLNREWNLTEKDLLSPPIKKGQIYYQAKDPKSIFNEHEIDYIYSAELLKLPEPNLDYAYSFKLVNKELLISNFKFQISNSYCPWVKEIISSDLI
jgi:isopentenyldiphosphate isomerase